MPTPDKRAVARLDLDVWSVLAAGVVYLVSVFFREPVAAFVLGVRFPLTEAFLRDHGFRVFLADLLVRGPALCVLMAIASRHTGALREALRRRPSHSSLAASAVVVTIVLSLVLNAIGIWPFSWRWASNSTAPTARLLLQSGQLGAIGVWASVSLAIIPFTEECVFRFGVLRALTALTRSKAVGVVLSALAFSVGHLGYLPSGQFDAQHLSAALWAFIMSLVLGWLTVSRDGEIRTAIVVHTTRNTLELVALLLLIDVG